MEQNESNTALLVMDMQTSILGRLQDGKPVVSKVVQAIAHARKMKLPVIYVVVGFRQGAPEMSDRNASKAQMASLNMEEFMKIHPDVTPLANDMVVIKRRISAFTGSDLEVVLRVLGIQNLVLTGISTSGVVLSTVREAADKDYRLTVLADGCADMDEEVHRVLTTKIFVRQATVITVKEWSKA